MRKLTSTDNELISLAKEFNSQQEFKQKNLPKFLIARSKNLLKLIFPAKIEPIPEVYTDPEQVFTGIYILYQDNVIIFVGQSLSNCAVKIQKDIALGMYPNKCIVYPMTNVADINILESYLINYHKPIHNTGYTNDMPTLYISDIDSKMGEPIILPKELCARQKKTMPNSQDKPKQATASNDIKKYFESKEDKW